MELKDFIKETLVQIANGAKLADNEYKRLGRGGVNPEGEFQLEGIPHIMQPGANEKHNISKPVIPVHFKLNIQVEDKSQVEGKVGGILSVISASVGGMNGESCKSVQEISFSIPVVLPSTLCASGK